MTKPAAKWVFLICFLALLNHSFAEQQSQDFQSQLDKVTNTELTKNETLLLLQNGETLQPLLSMLNNSKKFMYLEVLTFACDQTTEPIVVALERLAKAQIDVRLILNKYYAFLSSSCLKRLEKSGVQIEKTETHASFIVNDQDELFIGSQSIASMFFLSNGENGFDRDMMLYAKGPISTDARQEFLNHWTGQRPEPRIAQKDAKELLEKRQSEYENHTRNITLTDKNESGLCRFVAQRPNGRLRQYQHIVEELVDHSQSSIIFSGVKISPNSKNILNKLQSKSKSLVKIEYLGNGSDGGDGELTMILNDLIKESKYSIVKYALTYFNNYDITRVSKQHYQNYDNILNIFNLNIWVYFNFLHYKIWDIDHTHVLIGSANLTNDSFESSYEAAAYCIDTSLANTLNKQLENDRKHSKVYTQDASK